MGAKNYQTITDDSILKEDAFTFNLYLLNPETREISLFLKANNQLSQELKDFLQLLLQKGAQMMISSSQIQSYLDFTSLDKDIFLSSSQDTPHEKDREQDIKKEKIKKDALQLKEQKGEFSFAKVLAEGSKNGDYSYLYQQARNEISIFSLHYSHTVGLAICLTESFMKIDNFINRVVATTYFIAKGMKINNQHELSEMIVASYLHHIGYTHFPLSINSKCQGLLDEKECKEWRHHPEYAISYLKKLQLNVSDRCLYIIKNHHRRENGLGFPEWEESYDVEPFAEIVGLSSYLWEYSMGKIDGKHRGMNKTIHDFTNKKTPSNIDKEYFDALKNYIYSLHLQVKKN